MIAKYSRISVVQTSQVWDHGNLFYVVRATEVLIITLGQEANEINLGNSF